MLYSATNSGILIHVDRPTYLQGSVEFGDCFQKIVDFAPCLFRITHLNYSYSTSPAQLISTCSGLPRDGFIIYLTNEQVNCSSWSGLIIVRSATCESSQQQKRPEKENDTYKDYEHFAEPASGEYHTLSVCTLWEPATKPKRHRQGDHETADPEACRPVLLFEKQF